MEKKITFVIGGCRSGKSSFALDEANRIAKKNKYFIATSLPLDSEMEKRVEKHQKERGKDWQTIEEPVLIHEKINEYSGKAGVILIDCLTLWLSNLLSQSYDPAGISELLEKFEKALLNCRCPVFLVSNEVGLGIVPENKIAREFRDLAGMIHQRMAKLSDRVVMTIAGIDVEIKPGQKSR
ncbi:MAG: bifunctional adenosylcobinamide kinase/adenosylcobinamide-phosphate guanylyltransferase [Desulfobacterales bacterium RIFOXYA12_FULL_46_15]|nr:MAG: bifunctional adenosylcobinamide kinase/adenosylcobinamide-phosphate guanylyltransferase [Desulfobacula sp. GWF2_41_7]OGR23326.1 MAG: bifunctional adenosylcobinamide kinase/adenosylcobinamide-phosphate guanylyltransferase [Desulfobacterales bacterium RIFOXYA12_FULL_46_15]